MRRNRVRGIPPFAKAATWAQSGTKNKTAGSGTGSSRRPAV